ncbi:MAG: translation initiation factor IF-2 [Chloroflexi bacterium]|nr:translation initiation factor IF-2 [Chloroflexota bacterium]
MAADKVDEQARGRVEIPDTITVRHLAELLHVEAVEVIKQLMRLGVMAGINHVIDAEVAAKVAAVLGYEARRRPGRLAGVRGRQRPAGAGLQARPPVVVVMGHVDHGKTKLLDAIRQTNVAALEPGAITQHIGAYQAMADSQKITFLDTPGHEAFTSMRARGAQIADIAVLVVAADDGVMPQTLEAISHCRAAGIPIVVAINKIDKPEANQQRVKQQLADAGLIIEEWGGQTLCVPISAKEKTGIPDLLESLLLVAEMEELRATPSRPAEGVVIEARLDKSMGPLATVLVRDGMVKVGSVVVAGLAWGRIRAMLNYLGKRVNHAEPSDPVELLGLNSVPQVGDSFAVVADEEAAKGLVEKRRREIERQPAPAGTVSLLEQVRTGQVKELNIILKADVQGSIEVIRASLEQLKADEVRTKLLHAGTGNVTESDVMLAMVSRGIILGFGVSADPVARQLARREGVDIRYYNVIYDLTDDITKVMKGMVVPKYVEVVEGRGEVIAIFTIAKGGRVAGVRVADGKVRLGALVKVRRGDKVLVESSVSSLKRYKDVVREVSAGNEAGVLLENFKDFQVGDVMEFYSLKRVKED